MSLTTYAANGMVCGNCGMPIVQVGAHRWGHALWGYWCATAIPASHSANTDPEIR